MSTELTAEKVRRILEGKRWIFAKTMADNPHHYTLRREWGKDGAKLFGEVVKFIYKDGIREQYAGYWYKVLYLGEYKYWAMGAPVAETVLINRKIATADKVIE